MARKRAAAPPLSDEQVAAFRTVAQVILAADAQHAAAEDYDGHEALLNQLWGALPDEDYERFAGIIQAAADPDERCPK